MLCKTMKVSLFGGDYRQKRQGRHESGVMWCQNICSCSFKRLYQCQFYESLEFLGAPACQVCEQHGHWTQHSLGSTSDKTGEGRYSRTLGWIIYWWVRCEGSCYLSWYWYDTNVIALQTSQFDLFSHVTDLTMIRPVYAPKDFLEVLSSLRNPNYDESTWGTLYSFDSYDDTIWVKID